MQSLLCNIILLCIFIMSFEIITRCSTSLRVTRDASESSKPYALDLSHNDLPFLCNRTFLELNVVGTVTLSLARNVIRCIAQHAFLGLTELERLDLSRNNLTYIHPDTFNENRKLYWLSLADNKLLTLTSEGVFIYVLSLRFLDFSNCSVTDISYSIFKEIKNIKYLNISHNQIRSIEQGTFDLLKELRCLDISFNSLSSLHSDSCFSNVSIDDYLPSDSSESCLMTEAPSSVLKLKADNNPWNCDCKMKDLFDYISKSGLTLPNLTCKWPSEHENKHWGLLEDADCSTSVAPTVILMTEESVPVSKISSHDQNSAIYKVTEKPATNDIGPLPATSSVTLWIVIVILLLILIVLISSVILLFRKMSKLTQNYESIAQRDRQDSETNPNEIGDSEV